MHLEYTCNCFLLMQFAIIGYSMMNVYVESVWIYITFLANNVLGHFISAASRLFLHGFIGHNKISRVPVEADVFSNQI